LQQSGQAAQTGPAAEQVLAGDPKCDDALLFAADFNLNQKHNDKAIDYAGQLAEAVKAKAKPEGVADADWEKAKNAKLGLAYWYSGLAYNAAGKFGDADKVLRQAIPLLQDNQQALGVGLFNLGLADYKMAKANGNKPLLQDALKYSQQSAAIKGPLQTQAAQNVKAIRGELGIKGK
jgi:tetratricopeptide (TPR) repeat protein